MQVVKDFPNLEDTVTFPYVVANDIFDDEDIEDMIAYCDSIELDLATLGTGHIDQHIRKSYAKMHYPNEDNAWIFEALISAANRVNDHFYNYDLYGFEKFQYTVYKGAGSHYSYHTDMLFGERPLPKDLITPRKLSFSLILSNQDEDFTGGNFEFLFDNMDVPVVALPQKKGTLIAFPSFMLHRVAPLLSGVRKSIVFWACGPKFK